MFHLFPLLFPRQLGLIMLGCLPWALLAQPEDPRFGHVSDEAVHMTTFDAYPEADAVVLLDVGEAVISIDAQAKVITRYKFHQRIKLLTEAGQEHANFVIPYQKGDRLETLHGLKAMTYLSGPNGKVETIKLQKREMFEEDYSESLSLVKFSMPQAQPGAVLEVTYEITRRSARPLKGWTFQQKIPVVYSEYRTHVPEWFTYLPLVSGQQAETESRSYQQSLNVNTSGNFESSNYERIDVKFVETIYRMQNLTPLVEEPYLTNLDDYRAKIEFQLSTIAWPRQPIERVLTTWEELTNELMKADGFGKVIDGHRAIKKWYKELDLAGLSDEEKARKLYSLVNQTLHWNESLSYMAVDNPQEVLDAGEGDSGDLNLIMIALMRQAGLNAFPVLISTRAHGKPKPIYPLIRQFNSVLALVQVGEAWIPLDATDPDMPFGMLPKRDLNHQGFLAMPSNPQWINIATIFADARTTRAVIHLDPAGSISGAYKLECRDYMGSTARKALRAKAGEEEEFFRDFALSAALSEATLEEVSVEAGEIDQPFVVSSNIAAKQYLSVAGDFLYLQPMLDEAMDKNPFKLESRSYPVDFASPLHLEYLGTFHLPEGYALESMPEPIKAVLPNQGATFLYQVMHAGPMLQVSSKLLINQTVYLPEEYPAIRKFFDLVVAKHAEQIVFKKTTD